MSAFEYPPLELAQAWLHDSPWDPSRPGSLPITWRVSRGPEGWRYRIYLHPRDRAVAPSLWVASSRLGRHPAQFGDWFVALRTLLWRDEPRPPVLCTAPGTTTERFVRRCVQLQGNVPLEFAPLSATPGSRLQIPADPGDRTIYYSPRWDLSQSTWCTETEPPDFALAEFATRVVALRVLARGHTRSALLRRLAMQALSGPAACLPNPGSTFLLNNPSLTAPTVRQSLERQGAVSWYLASGSAADTPATASSAAAQEHTAGVPPIWTADQIPPGPWLAHWTRASQRGWPEQSETEQIDDLIFRSDRSDAGPLTTLCRILASACLRGTARLTRDPQPVTCWTAVPVSEFPRRRIFRPHLGRWDFEPYGLLVRRERLEQRAAQPVIYGPAGLWSELEPEKRIFFQVVEPAGINWSVEREWRCPGSLDLCQLPVTDAIVFVPDRAAAEVVRPLSRWPIATLSHP